MHTLSWTSTSSSHVTSDKSDIFLNVLAVSGPKPASLLIHGDVRYTSELFLSPLEVELIIICLAGLEYIITPYLNRHSNNSSERQKYMFGACPPRACVSWVLSNLRGEGTKRRNQTLGPTTIRHRRLPRKYVRS
jgi:hypothetical protein